MYGNCLLCLVLDRWLSAGNWVLACMCVRVSLCLVVGGLGGRNWAYKCMSVFLFKFIGVAYVSGFYVQELAIAM